MLKKISARHLFSVVAVGLFLCGCTQPGDPVYEEYEVAEVGDFVDYASNIQPIFENNCTPCHVGGASGGLSLSSYDDAEAAGVFVACDAENSRLYLKISSTSLGSQMPLGKPALDDDTIALVKKWISEGAAAEVPISDLCASGPAGGADAVSSDSSP
jgi:mono/diheme cytochrome c family protein